MLNFVDWSDFTFGAFVFIVSIVLAFVTPLSMIRIRHEIRLRRIRLIDVFNKSFQIEKNPDKPNASFEFVKAKYAVDLDNVPDKVNRERLRALDLSDPAVDDYLSNVKWNDLPANWRLLGASIIYIILCFLGFATCLLLLLGHEPFAIFRAMFASAGSCTTPAGDSCAAMHGLTVVVAITFLSSYVFTLKMFVQAVQLFDLNSITMLRAAVHMLLNIVMVGGLFLAVRDPLTLIPQLGLSADGNVTPTWIIAGLVIGFVPNVVIEFLFRSAGEMVNIVKRPDHRYTRSTGSQPLELIDGIDYFTRFRLEEVNVHEVQNLATSNPIMLHVETPYGIYQTIDWVAQAQLCTIVGPERFLMLRENHIRTVFDLERSIRGRNSTPGLRRWIAGVLLTKTQKARDIAEVSRSKATSFGPNGGVGLDPDAFDKAQMALWSDDGQDFDDTLRHFVKVMMDDLHVVRLRKIWEDIGEVLGVDALVLDDDYEIGKDGKPRKDEDAGEETATEAAQGGGQPDQGERGGAAPQTGPTGANAEGRDGSEAEDDQK